MIEFHFNGKKIVFTGDLGNTPTPLLRDTEIVKDVDYLIMESVYGDRNHENKTERKERLENVIEDTFKAKGTLLIPAFSLERTQEILFEIERMMEQDRIPLVPVYVDSPLAIKIIDVYKKYQDYFNKDIHDLRNAGNRILEFPQVHLTPSTDESRKIDESDMPKIIIAGAGMSNGGRIVHHEKRFLPDPRTTLLLVGYQSPGTMGRRLQEGEKRVTMFGESVEVRAKVVTIGGYSAHKDSDSLLEWVGSTVNSLKRVFVVMGEPKSSSFLVQRLRDYLGVSATAPSAGDTVELEL
jgi:metallo-beta-lactamase family protein